MPDDDGVLLSEREREAWAALASFTTWLWIAALGLGLMGLAGWLTADGLRRRQPPAAPDET